MSILQSDIPGAKVLDLFAGSGALGLEALSRGADSATLVEKNAKSLRTIQGNIEALEAGDAANVKRADAIEFAKTLAAGDFDVAFADPPYEGGFAPLLASIWLQTPFASILSIEHKRGEDMPGAADTRRYGDSAITFYRSEE